GITCWLASHDWIMSLEPEWTSTMFGVYNFGGLFLSSLAAITVLVVWRRSRRHSKFPVSGSQLHDLGTLLFAFSSFWMYLWFCQYWLIWYVNNPEETIWFVRRSHDHWPALSLLNLALNWGIPFSVLLFRAAKRNPYILGGVALVILMGRWLDLFEMILPSQPNALPAFGVIEAGLLLGAAGAFLWAMDFALSDDVVDPQPTARTPRREGIAGGAV
ncbi:MAG: quinol:cytochrome C oxidoreductase, partial [Deltaproteobacteria bacterium]